MSYLENEMYSKIQNFNKFETHSKNLWIRVHILHFFDSFGIKYRF